MLPSTPNANTAERKSLVRAFASFTAAAGSLERSYSRLQSEVTALREQLATAQRELRHEKEEARNWRALAQVSRVLAHEIRNPLASMELFASLLADNVPAASDDHRYVAGLQAGIRMLGATVNNVLQFHTNTSPELVPVDIADLVRQTIEFLTPLATQSEVEITFDDRLAAARVNADPYRLQQVLLNLGVNALRVLPRKGHLDFVGELLANKRVEIAVYDNGPGIPPEIREHLFEPGFTTRPGSLGLGLAVAKTVVCQLNGDIRLLNVAHGAAFALTLEAV